MGICYIFGAMKCMRPSVIKGEDYVIAADAGYLNLGEIVPDVVVGDFDSLGFVPEGERVIRHPSRKDDTDMLLAVKLGLAKGYRRFVLLGGLGGRLDHTISNIHALAYLIDYGASGCLVGERDNALLLKNSSLSLSAEASGRISVFAYGAEARGVTLHGLAYELENANLSCNYPLGVSNEFTGAPAGISVRDGCLLIIWDGKHEWADWQNLQSIGGTAPG